MSAYYSQCGEDQWLLEVHGMPKKGTFAEVGAFDGVLSSNTLAFEHLGWTGLLVEADPFLAQKCLENRSAKTLCCATGSPGYGLFHVNHADRGLSGLNRPGIAIPVAIRPVSELLVFAGLTPPYFLSIDTEGTELDVWGSMELIRPAIVMLEHQTCDLPSQAETITKRMLRDGYKLIHKTQYNLIFELCPT